MPAPMRIESPPSKGTLVVSIGSAGTGGGGALVVPVPLLSKGPLCENNIAGKQLQAMISSNDINKDFNFMTISLYS